MLERGGIYVDGALQPSKRRGLIPVVDPFRRSIVGVVTDGTHDDVDLAVRAAAAALRSGPWPALSLDDRIALVEALAGAIEGERDALAELAAREMGWPIRSGRRLGDSVELIASFVGSSREIHFEYLRSRPGEGHALVARRPVGVVGAITPWNAPLRSAVKKVVPALLAGCTVVLKPAPEAPLDSLRLAELASAIGLPPGVLNVVPGGPSAGQALVEHPMVRKIAFTGSTSTGRSIASAAALRFKRVQLELGGKSAAVVLDDADVGSAAAVVARSAFRASGQTCTALTRAFVPQSRFDEFVDGACAAAEAQRLGDPLDESTTMGPLVSQRQFQRVLDYLTVARQEGAVRASGDDRRAPDGWFVEPTVLVNVDNSMRTSREEIFGPVLSVMPYTTDAEALHLANDSAYGLHGAIFSDDPLRALGIARRFDSGSVSINGLPIPICAPFGGTKDSGLGREHGPEGFDHFLEYQSIVVSSDMADDMEREGIPKM